jgi:hypothetical protein
MRMAFSYLPAIALLILALASSAGCRNGDIPPPAVQQDSEEPPLAPPAPRGKSVIADESDQAKIVAAAPMNC